MSGNEVQAQVFPLYAVPMLQSQIGDASRLNAELSSLFLRLESQGDTHRDPIRRDTQYGIFESNFFLHQRTDPVLLELFGFLRASLLTFIQGMSQYSDTEMTNIELDMHSWFHVTRNGGFQSLHNHPNASWSAIYCVDPGDASSPESGAVRFHDPRTGCDMYRDPSTERMQSPYRIGPWQLIHKPGQMIAFPSYLLHEVFSYTGTRPRIVVALNAWCRWKNVPRP